MGLLLVWLVERRPPKIRLAKKRGRTKAECNLMLFSQAFLLFYFLTAHGKRKLKAVVCSNKHINHLFPTLDRCSKSLYMGVIIHLVVNIHFHCTSKQKRGCFGVNGFDVSLFDQKFLSSPFGTFFYVIT